MWPQTAAGWLTFVLSILTFAGVLIGWGKTVQQFNDLRKAMTELTRKVNRLDPDLNQVVTAQGLTIDRVDGELTQVRFTLWGPQLNNGMYTKLNILEGRVAAVEARNKIIDGIAAERERDAQYEERRDRRRSDKPNHGEG